MQHPKEGAIGEEMNTSAATNKNPRMGKCALCKADLIDKNNRPNSSLPYQLTALGERMEELFSCAFVDGIFNLATAFSSLGIRTYCANRRNFCSRTRIQLIGGHKFPILASLTRPAEQRYLLRND